MTEKSDSISGMDQRTENQHKFEWYLEPNNYFISVTAAINGIGVNKPCFLSDTRRWDEWCPHARGRWWSREHSAATKTETSG